MSLQAERVVYLYPSKEGIKGKPRFARFTGGRVKQGKAGKADPFSPESPLPAPGKAGSKIAVFRPLEKILLYPRSGKAEKRDAPRFFFSGKFMENKGRGEEKMKKAEKGLVWAELVEIEPALLGLAKAAAAYKKTSRGEDSVCANNRWYGHGPWQGRGLRGELIFLVGTFSRRPDPRLKTSEAYDLAYQHVYRLLPDCRNCGCMGD